VHVVRLGPPISTLRLAKKATAKADIDSHMMRIAGYRLLWWSGSVRNPCVRA
jgi:hypothetical protein